MIPAVRPAHASAGPAASASRRDSPARRWRRARGSKHPEVPAQHQEEGGDGVEIVAPGDEQAAVGVVERLESSSAPSSYRSLCSTPSRSAPPTGYSSCSIRSVLLPASMKLLGPANWYLPSWLQWLPHIRMEETSQEQPVERAPQ